MNKKGEGSEIEVEGFNIFTLLELAIFALALFLVVDKAISGDVYDTLYLSREIGLLTDVAQSSPGDISVVYDFKDVRNIMLDGGKKSIVVKTDEDFSKENIYFFTYNKEIIFLTMDLPETNKIELNHIGKEVKISWEKKGRKFWQKKCGKLLD